ncbi:hypothetical protein A2686_01410 [Candidatus Woesebacteria bacterium RIFCSPHIGHO2_01_FULL_38_10]|uniref:CAAX prenyl protease 2/Lysostaphin resistance protein A-like domain-containing protein n=1 Tax=Candidatus Woesebacteria bacterium RIFCSPLOWO2_01_FULL_39_10b TaxID=1802517 RepID=A0A1F8B7B6_9BACT|nr:MAG: hypothetical protein A2686_01410 [Candidatus Woesebacteria bacterium RIFCSPHIGHO2_01_FULL_38_10]OGM59934.1 MAG: hypothetical protein A2892_05230 [Candidatus Woesebacteria bacterium RIFCSPLOWO2_01_FULL_39_10b]
MPKKEIAIRHTTIFLAYLLVVWGFYRVLFKLPEEVEELVIKPLVWLTPLYFFLKKERLGLTSLGITFKNLFPAIYLSLILGIIFAIEGIMVNFVRYEELDFSANIGKNPLLIALGLSLATAISEEISFRGYLFARIWHILKNEWKANLLLSFFWGIIHIPISLFWWKLDFTELTGYIILTIFFGIGSSFVFARTKNVFSSILLHVLWEWPIILFR